MGLTFRRSVRILPGVRLRVDRRSWRAPATGRGGPFGSPRATRRRTSTRLTGPFGRRRTTRTTRRR